MWHLRAVSGFWGLIALFPGAIRADEITQTIPIASASIISNVNVTTNVNYDISSSLNKFDPALGTLTQVSIAYNYNFLYTLQLGPSGGGGGASASGAFLINGVNPPSAGGGNGTGGGGAPNTLLTLPFSVVGTYTETDPAYLSTYLAVLPGDLGNFTFQTAPSSVSPGDPSQTASLDLLNSSSLMLTYTYTTVPVPEPAPALVASLMIGLFAVRRHALGV